MAPGIHWVLLLQGARSGRPEHPGIPARAVLHGTGQLLRSRQHGAGASIADPAGTREHLHSLQDSCHDDEHLLGIGWWPWRWNGRDDHGGNSQDGVSRRYFMSTSTKPFPEITRAAERYLEQYGDPLVMNTYLKVTVLVLGGVCFALAALVFKSHNALANM